MLFLGFLKVKFYGVLFELLCLGVILVKFKYFVCDIIIL
jgi:hypothetical protein